MTDKEFKSVQKRVRGFLEKWKSILPLGTWDITPSYYREPWKDSEGGSSEAIAQTFADWRYLHAAIWWYAPKIVDMGNEELERCVVHELMHCLLDCLTQYACGTYSSTTHADMGQVEQSTTQLTLAVQWAYAAGQAVKH